MKSQCRNPQPRPQGAFPWLWRYHNGAPPPKPGKSAALWTSLFAFSSGLLNDCLVERFLPAPPTLELMTPGTWISTEGYRPFKCESFTKTV
ncbi:unnamed protein product, partial [Porites lobata]